MARVIDNQTNVWGKQSGLDAQRSDLWIVDFNQALTGLAAVAAGNQMSSGLPVPYVPPKLATYFANSVSLPDLKLRPEQIRRDARPYQMPSWDEPLDPIRMVFWLDCSRLGGTMPDPYRSDIYQMLDVWRAVVRAGRGSMSSEFALTLDGNYRIDYAYDVRVLLLRASSNPTVSNISSAKSTALSISNLGGTLGIAGSLASVALTATTPFTISNDLEFSMKYRLVNCWLGSFKLTELSYDTAKIVQIETTFYAEDIRQEPQSNQ